MSEMKRAGLFPLLAIILAASAAPASAQDLRKDVQVELSLADGKDVFRIGEPIRLVLSFTANGDGYQLNTTTTKTASPIDDVLLSPTTGVFPWLDEYSGKNRYHPDYAHMMALSPAPVRVVLPLNDWFRFDQPGKYSVRVATRRVSHAPRPRGLGTSIPLTTSELSFELVAMRDEEEAREVMRLTALLDATRNWQEEEKITEELSYLTGDTSTREKVQRFLNGQGRSGNYFRNICLSLFIARNRALVSRLLEAAFRNTDTEVNHQLLSALTALKLLKERTGTRAGVGVEQASQLKQGRYAEIQQAYIRELVTSLPKRAGKSRTTAAITILANLPKEKAQAAEVMGEVREILLQEFGNLHPFDQEYLLRVYWDQLEDRALVPAIERILTDKNIPQGQIIRTTGLKRLLELAPERVQPFFVAEIRYPDSLADFDVLTALSTPVLPEVDSALLDQIRNRAPLKLNMDSVYLKHKAALAARYATSAIYDSLMEVYQKYGTKWGPDARAALLAYFARYNEGQALPLIEQALEEIGPAQYFNFLPGLTRLYYSERVDTLLRNILESDEPEAVNTASYVMSLHGPKSDRQPIEARLERWVKEWGGRTAELDGRGGDANVGQSMVQVNLIIALTRAKSWKLPEEEVKQLERSCVTKTCRQHFQYR